MAELLDETETPLMRMIRRYHRQVGVLPNAREISAMVKGLKYLEAQEKEGA